MKEKVYQCIRFASEQLQYDKTSALYIADELKISRSVVSQYLNALYDEQKLIKINTRPVYFLDREIIEEIQHVTLHQNRFDSVAEFQQALKPQTDEKKDFHKLIGYEHSLSKIVKQCKSAIFYPPKGIPVLIHGPTGSGKSYLARLMYEYAINQGLVKTDKPFLIVNCSEYANNPELLAANLFGYCKGAFTGADEDHQGLLQLADEGVLFLDEVHCLKAECQEKLFLFMDQGVYHMLGDNKQWYTSNVRLVFATTELPEKVLLKTLLRRIPMIIEIPSLKARGAQERAQFIYAIFQREEERIKKRILISNVVFQALMKTDFYGNIGALENCIKVSCVNALGEQTQSLDTLSIYADSLPENYMNEDASWLKEQHVTLDEVMDLKALQKLASFDRPLIRTCDKLLQMFDKVHKRQMEREEFQEEVYDDLTLLTDALLQEKGESQKGIFATFLNKEMKSANERYGMEYQEDDVRRMMELLSVVRECSFELSHFEEVQAIDITAFLSYLKDTHYRKYAIMDEICSHLCDGLHFPKSDMILILFILYALRFHEFDNMERRIGIVLAHGKTTATSIAEAVNHMLNHYIFDAIDMPLDVSTQSIIHRLHEHLDKIGYFKEVVLLVDMGSLEEIYQGLENRNVSIGILNNVSTALALEIGNGLLQGTSLLEMLEKAASSNETHYKVILKKQREKVVVCSCASGIGAAEKLKDILLHSLPQNITIKVITYDYHQLQEKQLEAPLFEKYDVICVVGTLNPNLDNVKFIPIEDLIIAETLNSLDVYFKNDFGEEEMKQFKQNILHNFSLSNIMGNLTILNPDKLLEHVTEAIEQLQILEDTSFSSHTCFGLYVHICCLIERLVTHDETGEYLDIHRFEEEQGTFIVHTKQAFAKVEQFYRIRINTAEIGYIYDYIRNDK